MKKLSYRFPYQKISDEDQVPLAPIVLITLSNRDPYSKKTQNCLAFLDTGSDVTLVPILMISKLSLKPVRTDEFLLTPQGLGGRQIAYTAYSLSLSFGDNNFLDFTAWGLVESKENDLIIICRDLLNNNKINVNFDGKNLITTIQFDFEINQG